MCTSCEQKDGIAKNLKKENTTQNTKLSIYLSYDKLTVQRE